MPVQKTIKTKQKGHKTTNQYRIPPSSLHVQSTVFFSLVWSVGAVVDTDGRSKFDGFFRDVLSGKNEAHPYPGEVGTKLDVPLPTEGLVYDYMYDVSGIIFYDIIVNYFCKQVYS